MDCILYLKTKKCWGEHPFTVSHWSMYKTSFDTSPKIVFSWHTFHMTLLMILQEKLNKLYPLVHTKQSHCLCTSQIGMKWSEITVNVAQLVGTKGREVFVPSLWLAEVPGMLLQASEKNVTSPHEVSKFFSLANIQFISYLFTFRGQFTLKYDSIIHYWQVNLFTLWSEPSVMIHNENSAKLMVNRCATKCEPVIRR